MAVSYYNPRDFTTDNHRKVDDRPYGGGPGMVMQAEPILRAWQVAVGRKAKALSAGQVLTLVMSPRGNTFTNQVAKDWVKTFEHVVLIAGRYEGIDARVKEILQAKEVSVGDYILTGGELPALTIIDAMARQIPGVLGEFASLEDERITSGVTYTRPELLKWKGKNHVVPSVLVEGDHKKIEAWRKKIP
jgi:tRNA (guanine37-N1)-methyltransferase